MRLSAKVKVQAGDFLYALYEKIISSKARQPIAEVAMNTLGRLRALCVEFPLRSLREILGLRETQTV